MTRPFYRWYVTLLLLGTYTMNQVDRGIFGFLMEPIKRALKLSDSQLGFLAGPAMVILYATLGLSIARLADRRGRVFVIAISVALWSCMAIVSGFATGFWYMAVARVGIGITESGFAAVSQSLITEYHPQEDRTRALTIFTLGIPLGTMVSSALGGWASESFGWRAAFVLAGLPGLALAVMVRCTIREPAVVRQAVTRQLNQPSLRDTFLVLWRRRALRHLALAMTLSNVFTASAHTWIPTFFIRTYGMSTRELGGWISSITALSAGTGALLSWRLFNRGLIRDQGTQARIIVLSSILAGVLLIVALLWPDKRFALALLLPSYALMYFALGPSWSLLQTLCAPETRATTSAMVILFQTLAAGVFGLQVIGMLSDAFTATLGTDALKYALVAVCPLAFWAAAHMWRAGQSIRSEYVNGTAQARA
jgi:predicted MFS family arabinose efflux permease